MTDQDYEVHHQRMATLATPLLAQQLDSEVSSETLAEADVEDGDCGGDQDAANQSVGTLRAVLIILSLWGLIFLQGL